MPCFFWCDKCNQSAQRQTGASPNGHPEFTFKFKMIWILDFIHEKCLNWTPNYLVQYYVTLKVTDLSLSHDSFKGGGLTFGWLPASEAFFESNAWTMVPTQCGSSPGWRLLLRRTSGNLKGFPLIRLCHCRWTGPQIENSWCTSTVWSRWEGNPIQPTELWLSQGAILLSNLWERCPCSSPPTRSHCWAPQWTSRTLPPGPCEWKVTTSPWVVENSFTIVQHLFFWHLNKWAFLWADFLKAISFSFSLAIWSAFASFLHGRSGLSVSAMTMWVHTVLIGSSSSAATIASSSSTSIRTFSPCCFFSSFFLSLVSSFKSSSIPFSSSAIWGASRNSEVDLRLFTRVTRHDQYSKS